MPDKKAGNQTTGCPEFTSGRSLLKKFRQDLLCIQLIVSSHHNFLNL